MSDSKSLMLWKNDFKHERDWIALCEALELPKSTVEVEVRCYVCVAKDHYTHQPKECTHGGDTTDDCADCAYSGDYHFVDGKCVRREE